MLEAADIVFDCLPLRSVGRLDAPLDASEEYRARCLRLKQALETHGTEGTYFLYNAHCVFHLANSEIEGMLRFALEGTLLTDLGDAKTEKADLQVRTVGSTCGDLPDAVEDWFHQAVRRAVAIEFDRYIAAGELASTIDEIERLQAEGNAEDRFLGMYL